MKNEAFCTVVFGVMVSLTWCVTSAAAGHRHSLPPREVSAPGYPVVALEQTEEAHPQHHVVADVHIVQDSGHVDSVVISTEAPATIDIEPSAAEVTEEKAEETAAIIVFHPSTETEQAAETIEVVGEPIEPTVIVEVEHGATEVTIAETSATHHEPVITNPRVGYPSEPDISENVVVVTSEEKVEPNSETVDHEHVDAIIHLPEVDVTVTIAETSPEAEKLQENREEETALESPHVIVVEESKEAQESVIVKVTTPQIQETVVVVPETKQEEAVVVVGKVESEPINVHHKSPEHHRMAVTSFRCADYAFPGYYADVEARCEKFHVCQADGRQDAFLCPVGTAFDQRFLVCDWWYKVPCGIAPRFYPHHRVIQEEHKRPLELPY